MAIKYKEPYMPLHVVFATDKRGLYFTAVAIASLVRTQKERRLRISVLVDRLDEPSKSVLSSVVNGRSNVEVEFIDIHDKIAQYIPFLEANSGHWPYMVWARCFIDKVFPGRKWQYPLS
jgi:lipopolysaccharide biosynthesis glycosyltransferase